MEKINAVLVLLRRDVLEETVRNLNLEHVNLVAIITDSDEKEFSIGGGSVPRIGFSNYKKTIKPYENLQWLLSGYRRNSEELLKVKKFLMSLDVPETNIVNFDLSRQVSKTWLANLRHIEKNGADFFVLGNEIMQNDLDLKLVPHPIADKNFSKAGVNLSYAWQDLQQSCLIAKYVFDLVPFGTIRFVLIGLTPDSFQYSNVGDFCNLRFQDDKFKNLISDEAKSIFSSTTPEDSDLNFDALKKKFNREFSVQATIDWQDDTKPPASDIVARNIQMFKYLINICLENGAKLVGVVFPFAPAVRKSYDKDFLEKFFETIHNLEEDSGFVCVDYFNHFNYDCFADMTHLNQKGREFSNAFIAMKLYQKNLIPAESFREMAYEYFINLSKIAPKDEYNALMNDIFKATAQKLRRKDKIKVGFVLYDSSMWSGDDLYNFFVQNECFEPTVFLCLRRDKFKEELVQKEFLHSFEQLKQHGLNVIALNKKNSVIPEQDVLIYLTCFVNWLPVTFRFPNITPKTLVTYILYGLDTARHFKDQYSRDIFIIGWKIYFSSIIGFDLYKKNSIIGMPRGLYSGYPKIDAFFKKDSVLDFSWKMTRPDAKKIIWAPHWSIKGFSVVYATFQWNYKFMYEFAKAHPEISWVVKPHPNLFFSAVKERVFPSDAAFEDYLKKWNDLPNAQVYTGGYYQAIFETSDGMIHDSGSFIGEYQYMDKPMIYLTRDTQRFNKLGQEILKVSYLVDGKNFEAIATTIQKVFIDGKDDKAPARRKVFDKYLNYPKLDGMLASEFIYKSIANEVTEDKK